MTELAPSVNVPPLRTIDPVPLVLVAPPSVPPPVSCSCAPVPTVTLLLPVSVTAAAMLNVAEATSSEPVLVSAA